MFANTGCLQIHVVTQSAHYNMVGVVKQNKTELV